MAELLWSRVQGEEKKEYIWRRKVSGPRRRKRTEKEKYEYSAICLFEGVKIEGRDLQYTIHKVFMLILQSRFTCYVGFCLKTARLAVDMLLFKKGSFFGMDGWMLVVFVVKGH